MTDLTLPARYESLHRLGKGGGGEVWAVRDRHTGDRFALKVLAADATDAEMAALVREAVTLSGLEGLGVPRVLRFGRLPDDGRPFMVRELVEGRSLHELLEEGTSVQVGLDALIGAAEQVTLLHRAGLLHGDIKPANIIVDRDGRATLVDLGLAAPWRERGTQVKGLTPKYAAPELLAGKPLTVRAEVYALGVALADVLEVVSSQMTAEEGDSLRAVVARATAQEPTERFPSADEFAVALRGAGGWFKHQPRAFAAAETWPIVGIEVTASRLLQAAVDLPPGGVLVISGAVGSGRSVLLRRLAWSLGVEGRPIAWIDESLLKRPVAIEAEISGAALEELTILVDDVDRLGPPCADAIAQARKGGARLVVVGKGSLGEGATEFRVPPLGRHAAAELLRRAVPSLTDRLIQRVVDYCDAAPGALRRFVRLTESHAVVSEADVEEVLSGIADGLHSLAPKDPLERATHFLDRGRYNDARVALDSVGLAEPLSFAVAKARLDIGLGDHASALAQLQVVRSRAEADPKSPAGKAWSVYAARAQIGLGEYARALDLLTRVVDDPGHLGAEALAYRGLSLGYMGDVSAAADAITQAIERAEHADSARVQGLALVCLALVRQRADDTDAAREAYTRAVAAAERANDANTLATAQLNLAGLLKVSGDIAGAIEYFEAAVDMARRSGRLQTMRSALLNLANTEIYLGRVARGRESIEALLEQRDQLSRVARAQLAGLQAELLERSGDIPAAVDAYEECGSQFAELHLGMDAAEAHLSAVLLRTRLPDAEPGELNERITAATQELGESRAHRALLHLVRASVARLAENEKLARDELSNTLQGAREAGQKDWLWRALEVRAEIEEAAGQRMRARRDREEALSVLEDIATRLPRDLREVFWNDPRRRHLRASVEITLGSAPTDHIAVFSSVGKRSVSSVSSSISAVTSTPLEKRLARILDINAELLGEIDLERLTARVTDHAVGMLKAERGFVLLVGEDGTLRISTSRTRAGDEPHQEFSRSVAETVIASGEPVVSVNARGDSRMQNFASVHQLMLQSVACVPILARSGPPIGALYVETRLRPGEIFEQELPTLRAFADQVGIAIETNGLIVENRKRAEELERANVELKQARDKLAELLGDRTEQLKRTRRKLRDARDTLYGHFGYRGLVGTSAAMRRVYALIDRVKDTEVPVLITGESGTGKEVAARAIHRGSGRAQMPFLGVNCGAIPEHLLESELFGHVRGAFTGADRDRKGLFREGEGGTVLLDEIGEMPHRMQAGLLRVLQEKKVRPVGGAQEQPVDIRLVFATHRDLAALVKEGKFREDLLYRIHVVELRLPPLRERIEDVPPLVDHFLGIFAARYKRERRTVSREAMRRLMTFEWPGNVRQLEHVLLNAWILSDGPVLEVDDFDIPDGRSVQPRELASSVHSSPSASSQRARRGKETLSKHRRDEKERIIDALQACNWNRVKAAELSGIPRRTFYRRLREYGIQ